MILCTHCGVEVEESERYCPLCRNSLRPGIEGDTTGPAPPRRVAQEASRRIRGWLIEVLTLLALTAALVVFAADFATGLSITWARYPLVTITFLWLSVVLVILCSRRTWIYLPAEITATGLYLFILDRFTPQTTWFMPLAFPLMLLIGTLLAVTLAIARKRRLSPFAIIATALLSGGIFVVGLELFLNRYFGHRWFISWSAVVFTCLLPIVGLLLYLRAWLGRRQAEFRKLFHV
jgi:hypothetical protein